LQCGRGGGVGKGTQLKIAGRRAAVLAGASVWVKLNNFSLAWIGTRKRLDPLIHSAAGAYIGWALPRRVGVGAAPLVLVGALLPDVEYVTEPFVDPRSPTCAPRIYSLGLILILGPLGALVVF